ncbi:MAG: nucleoside 2-deoxyribosyltransferase [Candidatus Woesearchaeota archaeon]
MKVFLSYRFSGEDPEVLRKTIQSICESLKKAGHDPFCSFWEGDFFKENKYSNKQILQHALKELENSDIYLAFIKSEDKSEGMLIEAGYALAKGKKFYLAIKKGVHTTFIKELADTIIEFENLEELYNKLSKLK